MGEWQGHRVMARASLGKPARVSLTCVLGAGQAKSQGPERGQRPPADTHRVEGGEKSPGAASEDGLESAGGFCSPRAGSSPSGFTSVGGAGPVVPLTQVNSGHSLSAGRRPETGRDGCVCQVGPGFLRASWPQVSSYWTPHPKFF